MLNFFKKTDLQIENEIMNVLHLSTRFKESQLSVSVTSGVATLHGRVVHIFEKVLLEKMLQKIKGVKAVANEVEVSFLETSEKNDGEIAKDVLQAIEWSYKVPQELQISVDNGWVTLRGHTNWDYQRKSAVDSIKDLEGVTGVTNLITITSRVEALDVKDRIEEALINAVAKENFKINVSVDGHSVTLSGNVNSYGESEIAKFAAWNTPGVVRVINSINYKLPP